MSKRRITSQKTDFLQMIIVIIILLLYAHYETSRKSETSGSLSSDNYYPDATALPLSVPSTP